MNTASANVYTDIQGLASLKAKARQDSDGALDDVAKQFESLFMQMMLKSMRQAGLGEGLMDSDQSLFYRDMYDQQLGLHLSESGGLGLAEVIKRQLGGKDAAPSGQKGLDDYRLQAVRMAPMMSEIEVPANAPPAAAEPRFESPEQFTQYLLPKAEQAAASLGQDPQTLVAQAALETGWGKGAIRRSDGSNSYNLFGIKADQRWQGDRVTVSTLEFEAGIPVRRQAAFRAYDSFEESLQDYASFIRGNPRYQNALKAQDADSYLQGLQAAGYATDPRYAEKISAILDRITGAPALAQLKLEGG